MNRLAVAFLISALVLFTGCRRADVRSMTVEFEAISATEQPIVLKALARYEGIDKSSYAWDLEKRTLTLKYDSMKLAQSNVRYSIDEAGVKVKFPVKEGDHAGH